ncbi:hypothetical protein J1C56_32185 [Aminobacter anthyllidis]|uniref:Uncharacterized protein n=1 Tax=Aminobacter anthyllidis TaxID=1035067 RepID=A0A9X1AHS8_9HYPH|nr:hypothetical protein [Aminobacter anthyllidis]MBT1160190.1 hypothetical protein [Aminobacter anthyllidis]
MTMRLSIHLAALSESFFRSGACARIGGRPSTFISASAGGRGSLMSVVNIAVTSGSSSQTNPPYNHAFFRRWNIASPFEALQPGRSC